MPPMPPQYRNVRLWPLAHRLQRACTTCGYNFYSNLDMWTYIIQRRPDDFAYTMAIGDSITAGAFSRGLQSNPFLSLSEWRGQSYAAGMDEGAVTIPNVSTITRPTTRPTLTISLLVYKAL